MESSLSRRPDQQAPPRKKCKVSATSGSNGITLLNSSILAARKKLAEKAKTSVLSFLSLPAIPEDRTTSEGFPEKKVGQCMQEALSPVTSFEPVYVLINHERQLAGLKALRVSSDLHRLAKEHALRLTRERAVFHSVSTIPELREKLGTQLWVGENVQRGASSWTIHNSVMNECSLSRNNILAKEFCEFGVASTRGKDGFLYMCQYFR